MEALNLCNGIDVESWQRDNRAPVFPRMTNRWLLARSLEDRPTDSQLAGSLAGVFQFWFGNWKTSVDPYLQTDPSDMSIGPAERLRLLATSPGHELGPPPGEWGRPLKTTQELTTPLLLYSPSNAGSVFLWVDFTWRSPTSDIPWPVYARHPFLPLTTTGCPLLAEWALWRVYPPPAEPPPPPRSQSQRILDSALPPRPQLQRAAVMATVVLASVAVVSAAGAAIYVASEQRR